MNEMNTTISVSHKDDDSDRNFLRRSIRQWTKTKNVAHFPESKIEESLTITIKDQHKQIVGGLIGDAFLGCLDIRVLWIKDEYRGQGYGTKLMQLAEDNARQTGCAVIRLDTLNTQAPEFYKKIGFEPFGIFKYFPDGPSTLYFRKNI